MSASQNAKTHTYPDASARFTYTLREVYEGLGISREGLRRLINRGEIETVRVGGRVLILTAELDRFLAERRVVVG